MTRRTLGRGLEALIPTRPTNVEAIGTLAGEAAEAGPREVEIDRIRPNRYQPRKRFDPATLQELAESMRHNGVLQPLLVAKHGADFELIAGERRLRAARLAGLRTVPVVVREVDAHESLRLSILENVQREDLNPMEEAHGYQRLIDEFGMTHEQIGTKLGKSRSTIANTLRLLQLSPEVQQRIQNGEITPGHARALLGATTLEEQAQLATLVREREMSVRDTEALMLARKSSSSPERTATGQNPALTELEKRLETRFGTRVRIRARKTDGSAGRIEIEYYVAGDLERIFEAAGVSYLL
jgi:ParB family chromosome partitioning protein